MAFARVRITVYARVRTTAYAMVRTSAYARLRSNPKPGMIESRKITWRLMYKPSIATTL